MSNAKQITICNYIQRKLNESVHDKKMNDIIPDGFVEERCGYRRALFNLKKGLMKRKVWEITVDEDEFTRINTEGWK